MYHLSAGLNRRNSTVRYHGARRGFRRRVSRLKCHQRHKCHHPQWKQHHAGFRRVDAHRNEQCNSVAFRFADYRTSTCLLAVRNDSPNAAGNRDDGDVRSATPSSATTTHLLRATPPTTAAAAAGAPSTTATASPTASSVAAAHVDVLRDHSASPSHPTTGDRSARIRPSRSPTVLTPAVLCCLSWSTASTSGRSSPATSTGTPTTNVRHGGGGGQQTIVPANATAGRTGGGISHRSGATRWAPKYLANLSSGVRSSTAHGAHAHCSTANPTSSSHRITKPSYLHDRCIRHAASTSVYCVPCKCQRRRGCTARRLAAATTNVSTVHAAVHATAARYLSSPLGALHIGRSYAAPGPVVVRVSRTRRY
mmetsp:Transcript_82319/g.96317  ORF Transcript_82319/g.96317 Transcript_82319/m.96317 type:complete len:366 (+) Transcript_82319:330-1427(+)